MPASARPRSPRAWPVLDTNLIRLQCYEGLDANSAVYEWNYQHQLLAIKIWEGEADAAETERHIFQEDYLLRRPLLQAISQDSAPVLLVDEIDRADEEFEAYLLEVLSEFQITSRENRHRRDRQSIPYVVLTSNGTRELSDALRRRYLPLRGLSGRGQGTAHSQRPRSGIEQALAGQIVRFSSPARRS